MKKILIILSLLVSGNVFAQVNQAAAIANIDKQFQRIKLNNALANAAWSLDTYNTAPRFDHYSTGAVTGTNMPTLSTKGALTVAGKPLVIDVVAKPVAASFAKALLSVAKGFAGPLVAGVAIYDLFNDLKIALNRQPDGTLQPVLTELKTGQICQPWSPSYSETLSPAATCAQGTDSYIKSFGTDSSMPISLAADGFCRDYGGAGSAFIKPVCVQREEINYKDMSEQQVETLIATSNNFKNADTVKRATKDILDSGYPLEFDPPTASGPASIDGPTVTTQNPDGTTTTKTDKYNFNYSGDNVTYNISNTTTNNNPVTNTTTTSTTTTDNPAPEPKSQCELYPESVGCASLGTPPASDPLDKRDFAVSITPILFTSSSACPAPLSFTVMGSTHDITYDRLCAFMTWLRTLTMVAAAFVAAYILADSFRVT